MVLKDTQLTYYEHKTVTFQLEIQGEFAKLNILVGPGTMFLTIGF